MFDAPSPTSTAWRLAAAFGLTCCLALVTVDSFDARAERFVANGAGHCSAGHCSAEIPKQLRIEVEIDGRHSIPITAARLLGIRPDLAQGPWRAWRLERLIGATALNPDVVLEVESVVGQSVSFRPAQHAASGHALVLLVHGGGPALVAPTPDPQLLAAWRFTNLAAGPENDALPESEWSADADQPAKLRFQRVERRHPRTAEHFGHSVIASLSPR